MIVTEEIDDKMLDEIVERLEAYRQKNIDIDNQIERLERMEARMYGLGSPTMSDMPKASSRTTDRMADMIASRDCLKEEIKILVSEQSAERAYFEKIMKTFRNSDEKAVIRMRYFDGVQWEEVIDMMFGGKKDYLGKEDTYKRRIFKIRKRALYHMAEYMIAHKNETTAETAD